MSFFKEIEGEAAVLVKMGVYRQVPMYTRDGHVYAKIGGGFVRLMADGSTSQPGLRLEYLSWGTSALCRDKYGRLATVEHPDHVMLEDYRTQQLLGG